MKEYVVTEEGKGIYWHGATLNPGTEIILDHLHKNTQDLIKAGKIIEKKQYKKKQANFKEWEDEEPKREEERKEEERKTKRFTWDFNKNKDFIQDNAEEFLDDNPIYYDKSKIWWKWDNEKHCWIMIDETDIINVAKKLYYAEGLNNGSIRNMFLTALKDEARYRKPKPTKKTEIQFQDRLYDIRTNEFRDATPEYFCTNPLPYSFGESNETPIMDRLFEEWVGKDNIKLLYQIIAYCCLSDYPLHLLFCFIGSGRNGKSKFQQLLTKFIGFSNSVSTELDSLLNSRFESAKLHKKLVCTMGETNFGVISKTSLLKKLTGQDLIGFEYKGKDPFDDYNYAKIIINSNSLPISEDTSDGFYRRWLIVDFPNEFEEGTDILASIPEEEYHNLSVKILNYLPELLLKGQFHNQGSIQERKQKYIAASNPINIFLKSCTDEDFDYYVRDTEIYVAYCQFLKKIKKRAVSRSEFYKVMTMEGYERQRTTKSLGNSYVTGNFYIGLSLKRDWKNQDFMRIMRNIAVFPLGFPCIEPNIKTRHNPHKTHKSEEEFKNTLKNMGIGEELLQESEQQ